MCEEEQGKVIDLNERRRMRDKEKSTEDKLDLYQILMTLITSEKLVYPGQVLQFFSKTLFMLTGKRVVEVDRTKVIALTNRAQNRREEFREEEAEKFPKNEYGDKIFLIKHNLGQISDERDRRFAAELLMILFGILRA